jgi:hypothetical protein
MTADPQRVAMALTLLATAMYLIAVAPGFGWRRQLRLAAIGVYAIALAVVLGWIALWLAGRA